MAGLPWHRDKCTWLTVPRARSALPLALSALCVPPHQALLFLHVLWPPQAASTSLILPPEHTSGCPHTAGGDQGRMCPPSSSSHCQQRKEWVASGEEGAVLHGALLQAFRAFIPSEFITVPFMHLFTNLSIQAILFRVQFSG